MYKINVWSIVWCIIRSKITPKFFFICWQKFWKYLGVCTFVVPIFRHSFISDFLWSFWLFFCFYFMRNAYYLPKLMLLSFCCQKTSFPWKHKLFVVDEKYSQWNLDIKVEVFHDSILYFIKCSWSCIWGITEKEIFHSVPLCLVK